jgi:hypothetical protein
MTKAVKAIGDAKECTRCKQVKLFSEFSHVRWGVGGVASRCKECVREARLKSDERKKSRETSDTRFATDLCLQFLRQPPHNGIYL